MKKMRNIVLLMTTIILLACGVLPYELTVTKKETSTGEQPSATFTAIVFDTNTPVATTTRTPVATSTLAPSSTPVFTKTPIASKTPTMTPTKTRTPTKTIYYCPQAAIGTPCP